MRSLARWCFHHRLTVIAGWIVVLVVAYFASSASGSNYAGSTTLAGTPSAAAQQLLQQATPGQSGDTELVVFETSSGTVTAPAVQAAMHSALGQIAHLPNVSGVVSPYSPAGAKQISPSRQVAYATVNLSVDHTGVSAAEATTLVNSARAPNSANLKVDVVGEVAASTNPSSANGTLIGIVAAVVLLLLVFGSLLSALLPLLSTGIALVAALSLVNVLSNHLAMAGFTSQLCTLIGLGVGIDYCLFILTRTRTALRRGRTIEEAVTIAAATAGRAVLFAGMTVCIALLGMIVMNVSVLSGAAVAASIAVLFPMAASQTLLPALIGVLGRRTLTRRQRAALARGETDFPEASRRWSAWATRVQGHRISFSVAALAVLVLLGIPFLSMQQGTADYSSNPTSTTTYQAYERLAHGFGPGFAGPLQLVAETHSPADQATFAGVVTAAAHTSGVVNATPPTYVPAGPGHPAVAVAQLFPAGSPQDASTSQLLTHLRDTVIPGALHGEHLQVLVGGQTALADDFASQLSTKLPIFVGMVVLLSFLLLMVVFRSLLIPATAAIMNLLSAATAFGVVTAIFQWGWLGSAVGVTSTGPINPILPILMFAVLFGLSMDYEVFLVSRIQEEWLRRRDNSYAVNHGQAVTGKTITAAAAIMVAVFVAFTFTTDRDIKMIGIGMATAIAVDALLIRTMLVPAIMHTLGRRNWQLPAALDRRLPNLRIESDDPDTEDEPAPVEDRQPVSVR